MISDDFDLLGSDGGDRYVAKKPRAEAVIAADLLSDVLSPIEAGEPPMRWLVDDVPWGRYWYEPSKLLVIGGPTSGGKTALMVDTAFRALARNADLRVAIANVEDSLDDLLLRGIASHSRIPIGELRCREGSHITADRMAEIRQALAEMTPRLLLVKRPFTVERAIATATDFGANVMIFDYLQDLRLEDRDGDAQDNVRRIMPQLRALADKGTCVVVTAALSREGLKHIRERSGKHDYHELDTAIYRDASQIEHAMDEGFCLIPQRGAAVVKVPGQEYKPVPLELYHVKTRAGQRVHVPLVFDGRYQSFTIAEDGVKKTTPGIGSQVKRQSGRPAPDNQAPAGKGGRGGHWL